MADDGVDWSRLIARQRHDTWQFASPDGLVLLRGKLALDRNSDDDSTTEGLQFDLDTHGIWVEHPSLVAVSTTTISQTLRSINANANILTIRLPLSDQRSQDGTLRVTLHANLVSPKGYESIASRDNPYFSKAFNILLQGDNFPPPTFDPTRFSSAAENNRPSIASPSFPRITSPLLSPQRRAASQGSDMSVPPLSLDQRARSRSTSRQPYGIPSTDKNPLESALQQINPDRQSLASVASNLITQSARQAAEQIMAIRKNQELVAARYRAELEVLEARIKSAGSAWSTGPAIVKGFNVVDRRPSTDSSSSSSNVNQTAGNSASRHSVSRGRSSGRNRSDSATAKDEDTSRRVKEQDALEEENRGRSRSRSRDTSGNLLAPSSLSSQKSSSKSRSPLPSSSNKPQFHQYIPATQADDDDDADDDQDTGKDSSNDSFDHVEHDDQDGDMVASFRPHSKALVAIPETEELSLSADASTSPTASTSSPAKDGNNESGLQLKLPDIETNSSSTDEEAPFDMDEDLSLPTTGDASPVLDYQENAGSSLIQPIMSPPVASTSTSYRPGSSVRPTGLSATYDQLLRLNSMSSSRPSTSTAAPGTSYSRVHPTQPTPEEDIYQSVRNNFQSKLDVLRQGKSAQLLRDVEGLDAPSHRAVVPRKYNKYEPSSDEDDLDLDLVSKPNAGGRFIKSSAKLTVNTDPLARYRTGSLPSHPVPIWPATRSSSRASVTSSRTITGSSSAAAIGTGAVEGEDSEFAGLEQKTSLPAREGFFVPPLLHPGRPRYPRLNVNPSTHVRQQQQQSVTPTASTIKFEKRPISPLPSSSSAAADGLAIGPSSSAASRDRRTSISSLSQSLRNPPPQSSIPSSSSSASAVTATPAPATTSFSPSSSRRRQEQPATQTEGRESSSDEAQGSGSGTTGAGSQTEEDDVKAKGPFVPPHEWKQLQKTPEDLLSTSISD